MIGNLVAVFIFTVESFTVDVVLKNGGKKLNNHCIAEALVAAECLADSAEGSKSSLAVSDLLEASACVSGYGTAVKTDDGAFMNRLTDSFIVFNLTVLSN